MNHHVVILDFSHCFHRCFAIAMGAPHNFDLIDTTTYHLQGTLKTLDRALQKLGIHSYDLVFAEDRPPWRKLNLLPSYRSNRTVNHDAKKLLVKERLRERGVQAHWCHSEGNEADDVIATLVKITKSKSLFAIIVTGDRDLWQLIDDSVVVFNPKTKELVTSEQVRQGFPWKNCTVTPTHIALVKTLWGDSGDCIPNPVPRTQKYLFPIVSQSDGSYGHFSLLVQSQWGQLPEKCRDALTKASSQLDINWQLVKLDSDCLLEWD